MTSGIEVRSLEERDIESVIRIVRAVTGEASEGFWRGMLRAYRMGEENLPDALSPSLCQVAVREGAVIGFMIGDVQSWQFGIPRCGRIVAVGIHPDHRRSGAGRQLANAFFEQFRRLRVPVVQCMVRPGDPLGEFFASVGFEAGDWITLTRPLEPGP
ncbi:MAG: GNAT family N-acetyltransferase [Acidobacteriota bacterium]|jgi:ribosomal protein S18 acetylase RimI-like enzyme